MAIKFLLRDQSILILDRKELKKIRLYKTARIKRWKNLLLPDDANMSSFEQEKSNNIVAQEDVETVKVLNLEPQHLLIRQVPPEPNYVGELKESKLTKKMEELVYDSDKVNFIPIMHDAAAQLIYENYYWGWVRFNISIGMCFLLNPIEGKLLPLHNYSYYSFKKCGWHSSCRASLTSMRWALNSFNETYSRPRKTQSHLLGTVAAGLVQKSYLK